MSTPGLGARLVDSMIRRSLKNDFRRVRWVPPAEPIPQPCILLANHHGWHDGYVLYLAAHRLRLPFIMWVAEYKAFPLFGQGGAMDFDPARQDVRVATIRRTIRAMNRGERNLILFPEGVLHRPPQVLEFERSLELICRKVAGLSVVPVAIRYELSMHQRPECFLEFGPPLTSGPDIMGKSSLALSELLTSVAGRIATAPDSFETLYEGTLDVNERWDVRKLLGR